MAETGNNSVCKEIQEKVHKKRKSLKKIRAFAEVQSFQGILVDLLKYFYEKIGAIQMYRACLLFIDSLFLNHRVYLLNQLPNYVNAQGKQIFTVTLHYPR